MLLGKKDIIEKAKKYQTWLGSGYHQIGFQAKAALYALQNHLPRLHEDHKLAKLLYNKLANVKGIKLLNEVETNMISFDTSLLKVSNDEFLDECGKSGVLLFPWLQNQIRAVIHLGITAEDIEHTYKVVDNTVQKLMQTQK